LFPISGSAAAFPALSPTAVCFFEGASVPNEMGCISLYRQAQTPVTIISAALAASRLHQRRFVGSELVYNVVTTRWMKWIVSAKSGTSFEREIKMRIGTTLFQHHVSDAPSPGLGEIMHT
jgi:hypothetical protein